MANNTATEPECSAGADPITIWYFLPQDAASAWAYARAFQDRLGVPLASLFPEQHKNAREPISDMMWTHVRRQSDQALAALMVEYRTAHQGGRD